MHPDKVKELEEELAHEDEQIRIENKKRRESIRVAFLEVRRLMGKGLTFSEAAKQVGMINK